MAVKQSVLARFYDLLDGFTEGDPIDCLSDDLEFEMMFPGAADIPIERFAGGKQAFKDFMHGFDVRGSRFQHSASERRHNIGTLTTVDGIELMLGEGRGGRRNGTLLAAAEEDQEGKLRRYLFLMTSVGFPEPRNRAIPAQQQPFVIPRFFDRLDGVAEGDPVDLLSHDFQFEMVFPGLEGPPDERISGDKEDFRRFMEALRARGPSSRMAPGERRHHVKLSTVAAGAEFMLGEARNGRRNGTILAAAQQDDNGQLRRYAVGMAAVRFPQLESRP